MRPRRVLPRGRFRLPLALQGQRAFTADLSPGGLAVELARPLLPHSEVQGTLVLAGERFPFTGRVAWAREGAPRLGVRARLGIRFTGMANAFYAHCARLFAT